ncbi:c-type cytochrome [uncultured Hymenobacter sp.]|uniref:c-type cytochrome n=1 Tax=uncultured Hymenobacter sp. TaxID=170016 RepID=UPI0035C9CB83
MALFSGPARAQKKPAPKKPTPPKSAGIAPTALIQGKTIYTQNCLTCHQADGGGVDGLNPPLSKTSWVLGDKTRIINVLLNGLQGEDIDGEPYNNVMPSYDNLTDQQIADVLTFVRNSFGNKASAVKAPEVKTVRAARKK